MSKYFNDFSLYVSIIVGFFVSVLGGWDILLKVLIFAIVSDYITGLLSAIYNKKLSSEVGFKGIIKKVSLLIIVGFSVQLQQIIDFPLREIVITFFVANEGISLLENMDKIGVKLPTRLREVLIQLRGDEE